MVTNQAYFEESQSEAIDHSKIPMSPFACLSGAVAFFGTLAHARRGRRGMSQRFRHISTLRKSTIDLTLPPDDRVPAFGNVVRLLGKFNRLFSVWLAFAAVLGLKQPSAFLWIKPSSFTTLLGLLMLSVGVTTTVDDFKACFGRMGTVTLNFFLCYGAMPMLAFALAKLIGASEPTLAGMVLVGSLNGGQASNLCTLIAGADVALSVLMTTSTTLACIFMTPLLCRLVLGSVIAVDALGIMMSTLQVVIAPILLGTLLNYLLPHICAKVAKGLMGILL